jgi:hypothetical protein
LKTALPNKSVIQEKSLQYNEEYLKTKSGYFVGYWQNEKYFCDIRDILLKEIVLKKALPKKARLFTQKHRNLVSVHIRRGDYLNSNSGLDVCGLDYYKKSVRHIYGKIKNPCFLVFSDDVKWCKHHFQNCTCAADFGLSDVEEFVLMSKCRHNIIANSSFSWWGAWLNTHRNKIVIAPKRWFVDRKMQGSQEIVPVEWHKI